MAESETERKLLVQQELRQRGIPQRVIAVEAGVSDAAVSQILSGTYSTVTEEGRATRDRVLRILAAKTRRPELFPELQVA